VIDYSRDGSEEGRYSPDEIQKMKDKGIIPIAYLSIGEAEDLFYNGTEKWSKEEMDWISENRMPFLDMIITMNKPVLSVDYVDDASGYAGENKQRIDDYIELCRSRGYIPYAALSDRELDEISLIEDIQPGTSSS